MTWLLVTPEIVDEINALLPPRITVAGIPLEGDLLGLGVDLLTDCADGCPYASAREILEGLSQVEADMIPPDDEG
jgi:hypothetical protein